MLNLYIIAGCNGAGKTTASFTVLPEMLGCDEFINADEIARGLSPFNPDKAAIEAGRLMLARIDKMIIAKKDFAFETTLSARSFIRKIFTARKAGYQSTLLFFWLDSSELAIERVRLRVSEGGHDIPEDTIVRRYNAGLKNLFKLYIPECDYWMIFNNSGLQAQLIAEGYADKEIHIKNHSLFNVIKKLSENE
jgi:predicted ABC-type ATPase